MLVFAVVAGGRLLAAVPPVTPRPDQGAVAPSGKFIPNDPSLRPGEKVPARPRAPQAADLPAPALEKLPDGSVRIGLVTVEAKTKTISFPAAVNQREGLIEYALVTKAGKVHESLLSTEVSPTHLHLAALLLNWSAEGAPVRISVEVEWETNGPKRRELLEDLISLVQDSRFGRSGMPLVNTGWTYTGSFVLPEAFAAEKEGSLITLIGDPVALIGNPRPDQVDDRAHVPHARRLPSLGLPVIVRLRPFLESPAKP